MSFNDSSNLQANKLVLVLADLANYAKAFRHHTDATMAKFIDRFYHASVNVIETHNGRVVKFIGDSCHAVFPDDRGPDAVAAVQELARKVVQLSDEDLLDVKLGANVHCGTVIEGHYGRSTDTRYDVIGSAMNHTALMGRGPGIRISEPVYRQLASGARTRWRRVKPPATYHYQNDSTAQTDDRG